MEFSREDFDKGWKVCPVCRDRVFKLEAGFDCEESLCQRCNCYTCKKDDFEMSEGAKILSKG